MNRGIQIDLMSLLGRLGHEQRISLRDPKAAEQLVSSVKSSAKAALQNDALLHGLRTQNMFEALVVSLGEYKLLKIEDAGRVHPEGNYTAPDFRLILQDETQWLVEVKNVYRKATSRQRLTLRNSDVKKLSAYAEVTGCPLKFAIYWASWRIWTLVDATCFSNAENKLTIDMLDSVSKSELNVIGDRTIGTKPPLVLRFIADPAKDRFIAEDGIARFTIAEFKLYCAGCEIENPIERRLAMTFMQYGDWVCGEPRAMLSENLLDAIEFEWTPRERPNKGEHFEIIGALSAMFSRHFSQQTLEPDGVTQTEADFVPDWFHPLLDPSFQSEALPLWRFEIRATQ